MKGWKDTGRLMISVTFYLYANSVTVNYTVRVLLMAKLLPLLEGILIVFLPVLVLPISEAVVTHQIAFQRKSGRSVRYFPIPSKNFDFSESVNILVSDVGRNTRK